MSLLPSKRTQRMIALGSVGLAATFISYAHQNGLQAFNWSADDHDTHAAAATTQQAQRKAGSYRQPRLRVESERGRAIARSNAVEKSPQTERQIFGNHIQQAERDPSRRMPVQSSLSHWVDTGYDHSDSSRNILQRPSITDTKAITTAADCSSSDFASLGGTALVDAVKAAGTSCINELFSLTGATARDTFSEEKMVTIANAFAASSAGYDGTNSDSTLQLVVFLRAGYYVQYYDSGVGEYGEPLRTAIRGALDAFTSNPNFTKVNDSHGEVLAEVVTLIDSSAENARYLSVAQALLRSYNSNFNQYFWMKAAVNNVYTLTFRGHQNEDFRQLVQSDNSIVETLYDFANSNFSLLGTDNEYLVSNAGRELGRFLQYSGGLKTLVRSRAKTLLDRSSVTGDTAPLWVGVGEMVNYYDMDNCDYYNLCDFSEQVKAAALPISHTCSPTLRIRAQSLSSAELASTCAIVAGEEDYFHQKVDSGRTPVPNDYNEALEMVVFGSSTDYGTYAGAIYGIDTNNGGMYLEGDPSTQGNQARFIAYEAEWMQPEKFEIWNLTHEYIHYLDGRFNMFGDFSAAMSQDTIWWVEGFAEYISYSYRELTYTAAQQQAGLGTYALSEIYNNDYNSGQTRVYNWGYLAARFMFEERRAQVSSILGLLRPGNYTGYADFMNSLGSTNDSAFDQWLPCVADAGNPDCSTGGNQSPVSRFNVSTSNLVATFTDTSSDPDGSIVSRNWTFGDDSTSTATNPSHTYAAAGTYSVGLEVTDNQGASQTSTQSVVVTSGSGNQPPVAAFTSSANGLTVDFTDQSSDADGSIASRMWKFGDGGTSTETSPSRTYAAAGTYAVELTVTDDQGGSNTVQRNVTVTAGGGGLPECSGSPQALGKNCARHNLSVTRGDYHYMYVQIPQGTPELRIHVSGGTGNADVYVNTLGDWATRDSHNYRSTDAGNNEDLVVAHPTAGYVYISLYGQTDASGVTVSAEF